MTIRTLSFSTSSPRYANIDFCDSSSNLWKSRSKLRSESSEKERPFRTVWVNGK